MVRAIVGTLLEVGKGKMNEEDVHRIIQSKQRNEAGFSVPACGLYLTKIDYPSDLRSMKQEKVNLFDRILFRKIMSFSRPYQGYYQLVLIAAVLLSAFFLHLLRIY